MGTREDEIRARLEAALREVGDQGHAAALQDHAPEDLAYLLARVEALETVNGALELLLADARSRLESASRWAEVAKAERAQWAWSAEMACESPPEDCSCPGCSTARDRAERGEL